MDHLLDYTYQSRKQVSASWMTRAGAGSEGSERVGNSAAGFGEPRLPLQADRTGSRTAITMAFRRAPRSGIAGDLCRDAAHAGGVEGTDQQDGP